MDGLNVLAGSYNKSFQYNLLAHLFGSKDLLELAVDNLDIRDFELGVCQVVWEALRDYFIKYKEIPSIELFNLHVLKVVQNSDGHFKSYIQDEEHEALCSLLQYITAKHTLNEAYMRAELPKYIKWIRASRLVDDNKIGMELGQDPSHMIAKLAKLDESLGSAFDDKPLFTYITAEPELIVDFEDVVRVTTGIPKLDTILDGGLQPGELGQVTACPGVGKTNILTHFCSAASMAGFRTLLMTLELPGKMVKRRYIAMSAGVPGELTKVPITEWPEDEVNRAALMLSPEWPASNACAVADHSSSNINLTEIEYTIAKWKEDAVKRYGSDDRNLLVAIDWIKYVNPPTDRRYDKECDALTEINKQLGFIAKRQNVVIWIANQGTREADGKIIMGMKDTAFAYHTNDALDVAISAALAEGSRITHDAIDRVNKERDRELVFSIPKNRTGQVGAVQVYQAPTLRFFDTKQDYAVYSRALKESCKSVAKLYNAARPKVMKMFNEPEEEAFDVQICGTGA